MTLRDTRLQISSLPEEQAGDLKEAFYRASDALPMLWHELKKAGLDEAAEEIKKAQFALYDTNLGNIL